MKRKANGLLGLNAVGKPYSENYEPDELSAELRPSALALSVEHEVRRRCSARQ